MAKWAKIMFNDFINHFSTMDDKQIVKDVRSSIIALSTDSEKGKSFGAKMVHISNEWLKKFTPHQSAAGKRSWEVRKSMFVKTTDQNNKQVTTTQATTPAISTNPSQEVPTRKAGDELTESGNGSLRNTPPSCEEHLDEARQSRGIGEDSLRGKSAPAGRHCPANSPVPSRAAKKPYGTSALVTLTDSQAKELRDYYGEDFDRAVGILENYILSLPSKAEGDEKGDSKYWREDYVKRSYFAMRRDNWVDSALKKAKTEDIRLEKAKQNPKSFKQMDADDRTEFFSKSIFDKEVV